ncbi:MAG: hypothetical protein ACYTEV_13255 [Planctomycetota bacterium]|jgi:hypothetical protein
MTSGPASRAVLPMLAVMLLAAAAVGAEKPVVHDVEGGDGGWRLEIRDPRYNRAGDVRIGPHLGREGAILLRANTHAFRAGLEFVDGTIEFDVAPTPECHFIAIMFRRAAYDHQENIYLRPFKSGKFDAVQYAPRINGSTWQLYPEFSAAAEWPRDEWTHVRLEIAGSRMELYLDRAAEPALVVPRLRAEARSGSVGFWSRVNFDNDAWGAAISNLEIRPAATAAAPTPPADPPPGVIRTWSIAGPVAAAPGAVTALPDLDGWRPIAVEESGLANLNRALGGAGRGRFTAFARQTLVVKEAGPVALDIGYSDEVTVFLDGEPLFSGFNGWESRYPGYLGYVRLGNDTVHLPLEAGANELILAVTDDQRFGWGFAARLPPGSVAVGEPE